MATKTRGPYDKEDTEKDFLDNLDHVMSAEEQEAAERAAMEGAADDFLEGQEKKGRKRFVDRAKDSGYLDVPEDEKKALEAQGFLVDKASDTSKESVVRGARFGSSGGGISGRIKGYATRKGMIIIASIGVSIAGALFGFIFSVLPFELEHVKNVFETEIGGTRGAVIQTRSGRLYSRAFFFHQDADGISRFDGFRERGMVATLTGKNFRSQRLLNEMRDRGWDPVPQRDPITNRFTGRLEAINDVNVDGIDGSGRISSMGGFTDAWRADTASKREIKSFFNDNFPEKSWFWRARKAREVYRRWGLGKLRGNWIADGIDRRFTSMRMILRNALYGPDSASSTSRVTGDTTRTSTDGEGNTRTTTRQIDSAWEEEANNRRSRLLNFDGPDSGGWFRNLRQAFLDGSAWATSVRRTATRALSLFGAADGACDIKRILNTVVVASRVLRAKALAAYATAFMSAADITLTGEIDSQDVGAFTSLLRASNPDTGNNFFGSGSWQWASTGSGRVHGDLRSGYSSGGGWTGTLASIDRTVDGFIPGGASGTNTACGTVQNPFVMAAGIAGGIFLGVISLGSFTVANVAANAGLAIAQAIAEAVLVPLIIDMVAGTVIHGDEWGDEMAAASLSGYVSLQGMQSSNFGMSPMTNAQMTALTIEKERLIANEMADMSLFERYLSPKNHRSLTSVAALNIPNSLKATTISFASLLRNPFSLVKNPVEIITKNRTYAQSVGSDQCTDPDIVVNDFATDPFCNLLFGETVRTLSITPESALYTMLGAGQCDEADIESGSCEDNWINEDGEPSDNARGQDYAAWLDQCSNNLDVIHANDSGEYATETTDACYYSNERIDEFANISVVPHEVAKAELSKVYSFDDLYAAYELQDFGYIAQDEGQSGKAYAQTVVTANDLVNSDPFKHELFSITRMDEVLMDAMAEEFTGDYGIGAIENQPFLTGNVPQTGVIYPPNMGYPLPNGYYQMPESLDGSYEFNTGTPPRSRCGSEALIGVIYTVAQRWHQENPTSIVRVGDLNEEAGHVSHNHGIDVDITVGAAPADPSTYGSRAQANPDAGNVIQDPTGAGSIRLAQMFADTGLIQVIGYQDQRVINDYEAYSSAHNLPGYVAPWSGHADHFHVRILDQYRGPYAGGCND